jgi:electron transport complex protein RnfE
MSQYKQILADGLWKQNPGLIQFLGICPLLAVSNSLVNGAGLGIATLFVLVLSNLLVSLIRPWVRPEIRLPVFVLVIASLVTVVDLLTQAWFFELWMGLGIFIPLIVTNCVILARAESFASRQAPLAAMVDGIAHGLGFAAVLILLGGLREVIGNGTLFAGGSMLLGESFADSGLQLFPADQGFLLALLPPGAFLGLGLLIALRNLIQMRLDKHQTLATVAPDDQLNTASET